MRNIFITGGTGKIGGQLVAAFIRQGNRVITTTRKIENLGKLKDRFNLNEKEMEALVGIEVDFNLENATDTILSFFKSNETYFPHVLVNNARSLENLKVNIDGTSDRKHISNEYTINVIVPYELSVKLASLSPDLNSIINISSIYGIVPFNPNLYGDNYEKSAPIQYSLSKAAILQLSRELAIRFRHKKIKVNTVSYGGVEGRVDDTFRARYAKLCPEGNMLTEEQTVGPVVFLASEGSNGITGQNIIQDGGWTVW